MIQDAQESLLQMQKQTAQNFLAEAWREGITRRELLRKAS